MSGFKLLNKAIDAALPELHDFELISKRERSNPSSLLTAIFVKALHKETKKEVILKFSLQNVKLENECFLLRQLSSFSGGNSYTICPKYRLLLNKSLGMLVYDDPGPDLVKNWLSDPRPVDLRLFYKFALAACHTLSYMHDKQFFHGEIRPDSFHFNIDNPIHAKLLTIGTSVSPIRFTLSSLNWQKLYQLDDIHHKLQFFSPEQLGSVGRPLDSRSDIYSLGVAFYVLLTKCYPWGGKPMRIVQSIHTQQFPSVLSRRPDVPIALDNVIKKMTNKSINERFSVADDLCILFYELLLQYSSSFKPISLKFDDSPLNSDSKSQPNFPKLILNNPSDYVQIFQELTFFSSKREIFTSGKNSVRIKKKHLFNNSFVENEATYCHILAITGEKGCGKTTLLQSVSVEARKYGYFAMCSCQGIHASPFSTMFDCVSQILRQVLREEKETVENYFSSLWEFLGDELVYMGSLFKCVPELNHLLSPKYNHHCKHENHIIIKERDTQEIRSASGRLGFIVCLLEILSFTCRIRSTIIALDEVHLADDCSFSLIRGIIAHRLPILMIMAWGDPLAFDNLPLYINEVPYAMVTQIKVKPFSRKSITEFLDYYLRYPTQALDPLVQLLHNVSKGNPLILKVVMNTAYTNGCFKLNEKTNSWSYDLGLIEQRLENLPSFELTKVMSNYLGDAFSEKTRNYLSWAALLIEPFPYELLCSITEPLGLLIPLSEILDSSVNIFTFYEDGTRCKFTSCKLREGFLSSISAGQAEKMHAHIAHALIEGKARKFFEYNDIHHVLKGLGVVKKFSNTKPYIMAMQTVSDHLVQYGAYKYAIELLKACFFLLPKKASYGYLSNQEMVRLRIGLAMCYWWNKDNKNSYAVLSKINLDSVSISDYLPALRLLAKIECYRDKSENIIEIVIQILDRLNFPLEKNPNEEVLNELFEELSSEFLSCNFEVERRRPIDPEKVDIISTLLSDVCFILFNSSQTYYYYFAFLVAKLYLKYGDSSLRYSLVFLASYSFVKRRRPEVFLKVNELQLSNHTLRGRNASVHAELLKWMISNELDMYQVKPKITLEGILLHCVTFGDKIYGSYVLARLTANRLFHGDHIHQLLLDQENAETLILLWEVEKPFNHYLYFYRNVLLALFGLTDNKDPNNILSTNQKSQESLSKEFLFKKPSTYFTWYYSALIYLCTLFKHYDYVVQVAPEFLEASDGKILEQYYKLVRGFIGLSAAQVLYKKKDISTEERQKLTLLLINVLKALKDFAYNYKIKSYLLWVYFLQGMICRNDGDFMNAAIHFENAVDAERQGFNKIELALVFEVIGDFYFTASYTFLAKSYYLSALNHYGDIGCYGVENKLKELLSERFSLSFNQPTYSSKSTMMDNVIEEIPELFKKKDINDFSLTSHDFLFQKKELNFLANCDISSEHNEGGKETCCNNECEDGLLDIVSLISVIKCGQLLSSKLRLVSLLTTVIKLIIEYSQVGFAAVILQSDSEYVLSAFGNSEYSEALEPSVPLNESDIKIPGNILSDVFNNAHTVSLESVSMLKDENVMNWLQEEHSLNSFIIIPLQFKESVIGALYLRFPRNLMHLGNVMFLKLLSQQIAISISNALLFQNLRRTITDNVKLIESQRLSYQTFKNIEEQCITLLDSLPCIVWTLDSEIGDIEFINASKHDYFGMVDADESLSWKKFIHPEQHSLFQKKLEILKSEDFGEIELLLRKNGNFHWHLCRGLPLQKESNNRKWIIVCIDINDEKEAREAAIRAVNLKANFLANMSHELRTPFSSFYGMLSLLSDTKLSDEQYDIVSTAKQSCTSLVQIIDDLLNFSELESGKIKLEPSKIFDVEENIADCIELVYPSIADKPVQISYDIYPNVPALLGGDIAKLRQVITNLLGNSVKFTNEGHILLRCWIKDDLELPESDCYLYFEIEDTGIGLKPEQMKLLFRPFTQVDGSTTRIYGGSGLGLSICLEICKIMDGNIGVKSVYDEGSTFWFYVRLNKATFELSREHFKETHQKFASIIETLKSTRVLVVESFITKRSLFKSLFSLAHTNTVISTKEVEKVLLEAKNNEKPYDFLCIEACNKQSESLIMEVLANPLLQNTWLIVLMPSLRRTKIKSTINVDPFTATLDKNLNRVLYLAEPVRLSKLIQNMSILLTKRANYGKFSDTSKLQVSTTKAHGKEIFNSEELQILKTKVALIAEDNLIARKLLSKQLMNLGLHVETVKDGRELVEVFISKPYGYYGIIFADYHMPICDGAEAVSKIRDYESSQTVDKFVPVIALTADIQKSAKQRCLDVGMNDYLTKPFTQQQLQDIIRKFFLIEQSS
ncbi:HisK/Mak2 protein kinase Mak2 [Schizosaccharomyces cryophilus OY26]|uniref:histidine kinase n=1 Tax=Schizosaccharomyces cryophilus (strain OY26 / ATCC MYA-4695 / CBS 11777 / NBRC 106824 / NRRL Y48691) TaxID=653667 RepID=S9XCB6_SCHCR|nr:HisK/Mak2 protein kinase Mak2 [Schizosaccharomyces cryophilus OY26]EPY51476.1 HisK/Mak2 protein kinase Mak2 [Schizosaccharomyces cryophilus OY26]